MPIKRNLLHAFLLALVACLIALASLTTTALAEEQSFDGDPETLTGSNWMSAIPGERYLSDIDIPGTHGSALSKVYLDGQTTARADAA